MAAFLSLWSSCELADFCSSSDSSEEDFDFEDNEVDFESDILSSQKDDATVVRVNEFEAFERLKDNNWNCKLTALEMLQDVTHDSLNNLSSQGNSIKEKKVNSLAKKLERIKRKLLKSNKERKEQIGSGILITESQESFVGIVKKEKNILCDSDSNEIEGENWRERFRKPFNDLKNVMKMKRTDRIHELLKEEAQNQHLTITQLLGYLMYRENYISNRQFALEMLEISKDKLKVKEVPMDKTIAIVSRAKLGKTGYNYVRRMLKPHKGGGQKLLFAYPFKKKLYL